MSETAGCAADDNTPVMKLVKCPKCGAEMEIFVRKNDERVKEDEVCEICGYVIAAETPLSDLL